MKKKLPGIAQILFYLIVLEFVLAVVHFDNVVLLPKDAALPVLVFTLILFIAAVLIYLVKVKKAKKA